MIVSIRRWSGGGGGGGGGATASDHRVKVPIGIHVEKTNEGADFGFGSARKEVCFILGVELKSD